MSDMPDGQLSVETLRRMRDDGERHRLLDVREPWEVDVCAIPEALLIPMNEIPSRIDALPRDEPLVVMCHHGQRSMQVVMWLRHKGFANAINLAGGIDAWSQHVDSSVPRY